MSEAERSIEHHLGSDEVLSLIGHHLAGKQSVTLTIRRGYLLYIRYIGEGGEPLETVLAIRSRPRDRSAARDVDSDARSTPYERMYYSPDGTHVGERSG